MLKFLVNVIPTVYPAKIDCRANCWLILAINAVPVNMIYYSYSIVLQLLSNEKMKTKLSHSV